MGDDNGDDEVIVRRDYGDDVNNDHDDINDDDAYGDNYETINSIDSASYATNTVNHNSQSHLIPDDAEDHRERDATSGKHPGEKEAKRRKGDGAQDNDEEEEDPTIAELHYKALFHRDAVPEDGLALLEEEEMDGVTRRKKIGDEVTRKLLEARLEKAE